jgi:hypothetical protein
MNQVRDTTPKAKKLDASVYPRHEAMLVELAIKRRSLNKSRVIQEAIEEKAQRELDAERFEQLMAGVA